MNWQALLSKIGVCEPPLPDLVREASDRSGTVDRRAFLKIAGVGVAALAIDPELLIWTPGHKAILLPPAPMLADEFIRLWNWSNSFKKGDAVMWGHSFEAVRAGAREPRHHWYRYLGVVSEDSVDGRVWVRTTKA